MTRRPSYKQMLRAIRPYTKGFDGARGYDLRFSESNLRSQLTPAQKAKITRYWNEVDRLTARPTVTYKSPSEKRLRAVQRASQHDTGFPDLRAAFVPVADPNAPTEINIERDGSVRVQQRGVTRIIEPFDLDEVITDTKGEVARILENNPDIKTWVIQAGKYEALAFGAMESDTDGIARMLKRVMNRYGSDRFDPNDYSSSYFGNWMNGLIGYDYGRQRDYDSYLKAKRKARTKLKVTRKKARRKRSRR